MRRRFERELFLGNNSKVVLENVTFADGYSLDDFIWWEGGRGKARKDDRMRVIGGI